MGEYAGVVGGIGTMMSVRERPWHYESNKNRVRLVEHNVESGTQALVLAGIDWEVEKLGLHTLAPHLPHAEDFTVVVRGDTKAVLGVHKSGYTTIQNLALGQMADAIILSAPGAYVDTAGSLYEPGKVVWMLVRLPDSHVSLDSPYERWMLVCSSHDGSKAFTVRFVTVRVVCINTFSMAMSGTQALYTVRHWGDADAYLAEAREAVGMALTNWETFERQVQEMLDMPVSDDQFAGLVVPTIIGLRPEEEANQAAWDKAFDGIVGAYMADHNEGIQDTAWGAVNAFQEYEQWGGRPKDMGKSQMVRVMDGKYPLTRKAMDLFVTA